jgi:hypothetical protein
VGTKDNWKETVEGDRVSLSWGLTAEEAETVDRSLTALKAFFGLASSTLRPIVDTVVARPPMKEVLLHGGIIHLTVHWYMIGVAEIVAEFPEIPDRVCSFGFEVDAYDAPALRGRLFVTDSRPPFLPGGGIVAIEASHPTDPASTVSVRLLAANRSPVNGVLK